MRMNWDLGDVWLMGFPRCFLLLTIQVEVEHRAVAWLGFEPDAGAVALDNLLDEGEPNPSTGFLSSDRVVKPLEDSENLLMELGFDADAVVLDVEDVPLNAIVGIDRLQKAHFHEALCLVVVFDGIGY